MTIAIDSITSSEITSKASENKFYNSEAKKWDSIGKIESFLRWIFSKIGLVHSVKHVCMNRSWEAIENASQLPNDISNQIANIFYACIAPKNELNIVACTIAKIYTKKIAADQKLDQIEVLEDKRVRKFEVKKNNENLFTSEFSSYGQVDFVKNKNIDYSNKEDVLSSSSQEVAKLQWIDNSMDQPSIISSLFKKFFSSSKDKTIQISSGDTELAKVKAEGDGHTHIFRKPSDNNILAIATWNGPTLSDKPQKWTMTIMQGVDKQQAEVLFPWALLKISQLYLMSPSDRPFYSSKK